MKYEYHDAVVEKIEIQNKMLIIYLDLYPIFIKINQKLNCVSV